MIPNHNEIMVLNEQKKSFLAINRRKVTNIRLVNYTCIESNMEWCYVGYK